MGHGTWDMGVLRKSRLQSKNNGSAITQTRSEVTVRYSTGSHKQGNLRDHEPACFGLYCMS